MSETITEFIDRIFPESEGEPEGVDKTGSKRLYALKYICRLQLYPKFRKRLEREKLMSRRKENHGYREYEVPTFPEWPPCAFEVEKKK